MLLDLAGGLRDDNTVISRTLAPAPKNGRLLVLMSILVVCRSCRKRFKVSEKFAGKKGACPNCKEEIIVPTEDEKVQIHTPEHSETGARSVTGELVLKPVSREDTAFSPQAIGLIAMLSVGVVLLAFLMRLMSDGARPIIGAIGAVLVAPPLVWAAYRFLRNDDLEAYEGTALWIRTAICSAVYAGTWGFYALIPGVYTSEMYFWVLLGPLFAAFGITASFASFDLEPTNAFFHYAFYVMVTFLLAMAMGITILA